MSTPDNPELDDVAKLRPLSEDACVQLIQRRYQSAPKDKQYDKIHTRAGGVVVAINPLTYDAEGTAVSPPSVPIHPAPSASSSVSSGAT
jgi:hypothetical protein